MVCWIFLLVDKRGTGPIVLCCHFGQVDAVVDFCASPFVGCLPFFMQEGVFVPVL